MFNFKILNYVDEYLFKYNHMIKCKDFYFYQNSTFYCLLKYANLNLIPEDPAPSHPSSYAIYMYRICHIYVHIKWI